MQNNFEAQVNACQKDLDTLKARCIGRIEFQLPRKKHMQTVAWRVFQNATNFQIQAYEDRTCGTELRKKGMEVGKQKYRCTG